MRWGGHSGGGVVGGLRVYPSRKEKDILLVRCLIWCWVMFARDRSRGVESEARGEGREKGYIYIYIYQRLGVG